MNAKLRWMRSVAALVLILAATVFLANLFAGPRRSEAPLSVPAALDVRTPVYTAGTSTFTTPLLLAKPPPVDLPVQFIAQSGEPEIKIDIFGNIYVAAINGVPGGTDLWKSVDNGATFQFMGQPDGAQDHCPTLPLCAGLGGADDSIDVSTSGFLYISSLWAGDVTVSTSFDGGMGGVLPGQAWQVNPLGAAVSAADDRQWLAAYGPETVYMSYREAPGTGSLFLVKSTDAAKTFGAPVLIKLANSTQGNLVVDPYNGNVYSTTIPGTALNQINLLKSTDGGATWAETTIRTGPAGTVAGLKFTILAVDRGGNLHLVYSEGTGTTIAPTSPHVYLMSSTNGGTSWLDPVRVDSGPGNISAVMPWVVAGSPGVVDITWLGSTTTTPSGPIPPTPPQPTWHLFFAQVTQAVSNSPVIAQVQVSTSPIHDRVICFNGSGCTGSGENNTRMLLEYYAMTVDPNGNAHIAYPDSITNCNAASPTDPCFTRAWHTKQTSGPSALAPPAPPAPATFAANIPVGAPGSEPSIWVDSFNCVYVTAPGNPWVWKSINNGASFLPPVNPVADELTLTGGDEDIISLPKQNGSHTRPDQLYFTDLGLSTCHIRKSTDGNATWFKPGPGGAAGDVSVSSDRQWLAGDQGVPAAGDQVIYHWEHELVSEAMRISSLVNDTAWQFTSGMTDPELIDLLSSTLPNTNPGPIFVNKTTHRVFGLFNGSVPTNNAADPPFGKLLNVWEMDAAPPLNAASPVTDVQNHPVFKGVYDSPNNPPPAVGPPVGPTFGTNNAHIFPAGDIDSAGNIYVAWSMNNSRTNEFSIWFASSHDNGKTYYGPFWVSSGPMTADETAVFPWVAAGDNGRVDIIWYGTSAVGDPNTITGNPAWRLFFAQSLNANSREPVFRVVQTNPANVIHNGQISTGGLLGSSDRSLLDFMEVAIGPDGFAHAIFADNGGQATRAEYTRQIGGPVAKANPTNPTCLEGLQLGSVVSRKTHGGADFDVQLPLVGPVGIECRNGQPATGNHKLIFTFANPLTAVADADVTQGTGEVQSSSIGANPRQYIVNLEGVTNAQTITVKLTGVNDGSNFGDVSVQMGVLLGDVNATRVVTTADTNRTKGEALKPVDSGNFRTDVNVTGNITTADTNLVKGKALTRLD